MKVVYHRRIKGGWGMVEDNLPPAEVKTLRREMKAKIKALQEANPGKNNFEITKPGDFVWGHCGGTCSELAAAGVCVACLGREPGCKHCDGAGEWDAPLDYQI